MWNAAQEEEEHARTHGLRGLWNRWATRCIPIQSKYNEKYTFVGSEIQQIHVFVANSRALFAYLELAGYVT